MPCLSRITLYPVKALPGCEVETAALTPSGGLRHDREFALVDSHGKFFNGKLRPSIHRLDASCALYGDTVRVTLRDGSGDTTFVLGPTHDAQHDRAALESRLSKHFGEPVHIEQQSDGGFPDDTDSPGPTVISSASLIEVARWYSGHTEHDMRRRFRANLEISDCPAFWEDRLFGDPGVEVAFRISDVQLIGVNPCQRCVVPTRDPANGSELPGFQRTFVARRKATLPAWANRLRFDFYYRLSLNTRPRGDQSRHTIRLGDAVEIE